MLASIVVKVSIQRPFGEVYDFVADPVNFSRWATNTDSIMEPLGGNDWLVDLARGRMTIRFSPRNIWGVLDYEVFPLGGHNGPVTPVRLVSNDDGCDLFLVWYQRPGVSDEQFKSDAEWAESDLLRLKAVIEARPPRPPGF